MARIFHHHGKGDLRVLIRGKSDEEGVLVAVGILNGPGLPGIHGIAQVGCKSGPGGVIHHLPHPLANHVPRPCRGPETEGIGGGRLPEQVGCGKNTACCKKTCHHGHFIGGHQDLPLPDGKVQSKPFRWVRTIPLPIVPQVGRTPPAPLREEKGSLVENPLNGPHNLKRCLQAHAVCERIEIHIAGLRDGIGRSKATVARRIPALPGSGPKGIGSIAEGEGFIGANRPSGEGKKEEQGLEGGSRGIESLKGAVEEGSVRTPEKGFPVCTPVWSQKTVRVK